MRFRNFILALMLCFVPALTGCSNKPTVVEDAVQSPAEDEAYEESMEDNEPIGDK